MRDLLLDALATFRLARLVTTDDIFEEPREAVRRWAEPRADRVLTERSRWRREKIVTLTGCPWCVSVHTGLLVVALRRLAPRLWDPLAKALAYSAVTGLIASRED